MRKVNNKNYLIHSLLANFTFSMPDGTSFPSSLVSQSQAEGTADEG